MPAPLIAIVPCGEVRDYEESVRRSGGTPWTLDLARDTPADVLARADGLLLTGGGDVLPAIYGAPAHRLYDAAEPGRDDYELELVRRVSPADLPLLAICRGLQVLNVARGGTLVQDIPSALPAALPHDVATPRAGAAHDIWVTPGSRLDVLLTPGGARGVNSRHHQAIETSGHDLVVTATAPDGVVEAVEDPTRRFCVGVQWHPENFYRTGEFRGLFDGLVRACVHA